MALVAVSAQRDTEKVLIKKERAELADDPQAEHAELSGILQGYGITRDTADKAATEIGASDSLAAHLQLELGLDTEDLTNPITAALSDWR